MGIKALKWSRPARERLNDIGRYIAQQSPQNAKKVVQAIREKARQIPPHPLQGQLPAPHRRHQKPPSAPTRSHQSWPMAHPGANLRLVPTTAGICNSGHTKGDEWEFQIPGGGRANGKLEQDRGVLPPKTDFQPEADLR